VGVCVSCWCHRIRAPNIPFPLTPALSPREKVNRRHAGVEPGVVVACGPTRKHPLPEGEGRGEGGEEVPPPVNDCTRKIRPVGVFSLESDGLICISAFQLSQVFIVDPFTLKQNICESAKDHSRHRCRRLVDSERGMVVSKKNRRVYTLD